MQLFILTNIKKNGATSLEIHVTYGNSKQIVSNPAVILPIYIYLLYLSL